MLSTHAVHFVKIKIWYTQTMKKEAPKTKKILVKKKVASDPHTEEIKHYIGIVAEDFQHRLSAIAEQFSGLNEKIDKNTEMLNEKIDKNTEILNTHTLILNEHSKILDNHTEMLDTHTEMIGHLMIDMEEVKVGLQQKVSRDEFNKLESRLVSLEAIVLSRRATGAHTSKSK